MMPQTSHPSYGSDLIVDMIKQFDIPWIALNPGSTYRGLHDSLVNYGGNQPPMILCLHEQIAIFMAMGYAQVTGKPAVAIVHDTVGVLNGALAVYHAYLEHVPLIILGSHGPVGSHSAVPEYEPIRHYVKWAHQADDADDVAASFARAYRIAMQEPKGPVYLCYGSDFQEATLEGEITLPDPSKSRPGTLSHPDPGAMDELAQRLVNAQHPVIVAGATGRHPESFYNLVELAEALGAPVIEQRDRLNFPSRHPLNATQLPHDAFADVDCILALDVRDLSSALRSFGSSGRRNGLYIADVGYRDVEISKWTEDYGGFAPADLQVTASTKVAIPALASRVANLVGTDADARRRAQTRFETIAKLQNTFAHQVGEQLQREWSDVPIAPSRLASEVWEAIKGEDWVLTVNPLWGEASRIWDFDKPERWTGVAPGMQTGRTIAASLGIAQAHKDSGRLVVDLQNDGDLLFAPEALWTAANQEIPLLIVMNNNRAYGNDWGHQVHIAQQRERPVENAGVGQEISDPAPDFATIARGFGLYAEGPIEDPGEIQAALQRAIAVVKQGKPALIDVVTAGRW